MKLSLIALILLGAGLAYAQSPTPRMSTVVPQKAKTGEVVAVTGTNLDKSVVAKVYLTDGSNDTPVVIEEQTATTIEFKIPYGIAPGRMVLMVLTTGKDAVYIEEPVKLDIYTDQT